MTRTEGERTVRVIQGSIDSLVFYDVTEDELVLLENGPSSGLFLNFGIALWSISLSFFASIFTVSFGSLTVFVVFLVIAIVTLISAFICSTLWWKNRRSYRGIIERIRSRALKPEVITNSDIKDAVMVREQGVLDPALEATPVDAVAPEG